MSRIKSKDTEPETKMRKLIHALGLRYYKHVRSLPGSPDIVFPRRHIVVFIDGDFWHGWHFDEWKAKLSEYWLHKIEGNMARDIKNSEKLTSDGWTVIRIWEHDVKRNADACLDLIVSSVRPAQ